MVTLKSTNSPASQSLQGSEVAKPVNQSSLLVRALLAYSVHEHGNEGGTASRVELSLGPRACMVVDNGRGIGLHRDGYVTGLIEQLALRQNEVALHGLGLAIVAMSSPLMTIEARRDGRLRTQEFSWGVALAHVKDEPSEGPSGSRISFTLPDAAPEIDIGEVTAQVDHWRKAHPGLRIDVSVDGARAL